ncbi:MAG: YwaF family protein [Eubacteriales bacterium]|nr:YwaF family protein [Eubacteriales bacterium]
MPELFGWQHLTYNAVVVILMAVGLVIIKKRIRTEKALAVTVKITAAVLLACVVWNRLSVCIMRDGFAQVLPGSFCSMSSFTFAISALFCKKDSKVFHFVLYLGLVGGIATLVYPDFIGQASYFMYPMTISGMVHHTIMVFLALLMLMTGYIKPTIKKWYCLPVGTSLFITYGLILIKAFGYGDAMSINEPLVEGTPLTFYVAGVIFLTVHALFLIVWELMQKKVASNSNRLTRSEIKEKRVS